MTARSEDDRSGSGQIEIRDLGVSFHAGGRSVAALDRLSFTVYPGEFLSLLGTSGCGKSTVLNVIAGFIQPTQGAVFLDGRPIDAPGPDRGMVFQRHALFPWRTVWQNVEFGLRMTGIPEPNRSQRVEHFLSLVGLAGFEDRYPAELSGGMEQRVGLARVLALDSQVLLMDEPFGALDAQTRMLMQELLLDIWEQSHRTVVFVTHDVEEAVLLADRILVLTARPAHVKQEIPVTLARPRSYNVVTTPAFATIKQQALARFVRKASEPSTNGLIGPSKRRRSGPVS